MYSMSALPMSEEKGGKGDNKAQTRALDSKLSVLVEMAIG